MVLLHCGCTGREAVENFGKWHVGDFGHFGRVSGVVEAETWAEGFGHAVDPGLEFEGEVEP